MQKKINKRTAAGYAAYPVREEGDQCDSSSVQVLASLSCPLQVE